MSLRVSAVHLARLSAIRSEISGRLWRVNQGMPGVVFDALINQMALLQDKYEQRKLLDRC